MSKMVLMSPSVASHGGDRKTFDIPLRRTVALDLAILLLLAGLVFSYSAMGFDGSDDANYIATALKILHGGLFIPSFLGDFRYPIILPVSLSTALFGNGEISAALPTFLYALSGIAIAYLGMRALVDRATGVVAALLFIAVPLLPQLSLTVGDDPPELFFAALSLMLVLWGFRTGKGWPVFLVAGIAAGLAYMTRPSVIGLIALYGLLFLANYGRRRSAYFIMAAGFILILLPEYIWFAVATGNPFYQEALVLHGMQTAQVVQPHGAISIGSRRLLDLGLPLDAALFALFHPMLGLMFPAAIAAAIWAIRHRGEPGVAGDRAGTCLCFCLWALLGFLVSGLILGGLVLAPRYFLVPLFAATMAVSIWFRTALLPRHRKIGIAMLLVFLAVDVAGATLTNTNPLFAERALAAFAARSDQPIDVAPETLVRGRLLFYWAGVSRQLTDAPPQPNDLFWFNPRYAVGASGHNVGFEQRAKQFDLRLYQPRADWVTLQRFEQPRGLVAKLLRATGLDAMLPGELVRRIEHPNAAAILYRVPGRVG